jgi:hypothetical protein
MQGLFQLAKFLKNSDLGAESGAIRVTATIVVKFRRLPGSGSGSEGIKILL